MDIIILGAQGQLGWELGAALAPLGRVTALGRAQADLEKPQQLEEIIRKLAPAVIVNAAAHTKVDLAEEEPGRAFKINAEAPALLARLAGELSAWLVHYSTDYVYDGLKDAPYTEDDPTGPLNVYGRSKLAGDQAIMASGCRHLIFRTSWVFSEKGRNFPRSILELAGRESEFKVVADQFGSPTGVELLAPATALALSRAMTCGGRDLSGLYHLVAGGYTNWRDYAAYLVEKALAAGWDLKSRPDSISPRSTEQSGRAARRPSNSRLSTEKFQKTFGLTPAPWQYYVDRLINVLTSA